MPTLDQFKLYLNHFQHFDFQSAAAEDLQPCRLGPAWLHMPPKLGPSPTLTIPLNPGQLPSPLSYTTLLNIQYLPQISPSPLPHLVFGRPLCLLFLKEKRHHWAVIPSHSQIHAFFTHNLLATSDNNACPFTGLILIQPHSLLAVFLQHNKHA